MGLYCLPRYTKAQISPRAPVQPRPAPSQRIEFGTCTLLQLIRLGFTMYTPTPPKQSTARAANGALPNIAFLLSCRKPRRTSLSDGRGWSLGSRQPASPNGLDALCKKCPARRVCAENASLQRGARRARVGLDAAWAPLARGRFPSRSGGARPVPCRESVMRVATCIGGAALAAVLALTGTRAAPASTRDAWIPTRGKMALAPTQGPPGG